MNKRLGRGLILLSTLLLVACGTDEDDGGAETPEENGTEVVSEVPDDLEENWAEYLQEGTDNLESYGSNTLLDIVTTIGSGAQTDEDTVEIQMYIDGDLDKGHNIIDQEEMYFEGNDVYMIENGEWVYYPDGGPIEYPSWYPNIVNSLVEIEDLVEAEYSGNTVTLTYEGFDQEAWDAFEQEFALNIEGISQENIEVVLEANMDDSSYYLQDLTIDIEGIETEEDVELANVSILVEVDYFDHDTVDFTEVEREIEEDLGN